MSKPPLSLGKPPAPPTGQSAAEKAARLAATADFAEEATQKAGVDSKPWLLADKSQSSQFLFRMDGVLAAKLQWAYENHAGRPSKTKIVALALERYLDELIIGK